MPHPADDPRDRDHEHDRDRDASDGGAPDDVDVTVEITVVRSGGLAGLVRTWRVAAPAAAEPRWVALIDACDWDDATAPGADRYQWDIEAAVPPVYHRAQVADGALLGPWRTLVDAVRDAHAAAETRDETPAETRGARRDPRA